MIYTRTEGRQKKYGYTERFGRQQLRLENEDGVTQAARSIDGTVWLVIAMETKTRPGQECSRWTINRVYPNGTIAVSNKFYSKKDIAMAAAQKESDQINGNLISRVYAAPAVAQDRKTGRKNPKTLTIAKDHSTF